MPKTQNLHRIHGNLSNPNKKTQQFTTPTSIKPVNKPKREFKKEIERKKEKRWDREEKLTS